MRHSKKGIIAMIGITLLFTVVLLMVWMSRLNDGKLGNTTPIGADQMEILKTYQRAEEDLLYLDISAQQAAADAVHDLAASGMGAQGCGTYGGYAIWNDGLHDCSPQNPEQHLSDTFNDRIDFYLQDTLFPSRNFVVTTRQEDETLYFTAQPMRDLEIPLTLSGHYEPSEHETSSRYEFIRSPHVQSFYARPVTHIVIHASRELSYVDTRTRFLDPSSRESAHYVIDRDGSITQYVSDDAIAFHVDCEEYTCEPTNLKDISIGIVLVNLVERCGSSELCTENKCCDTNECKVFYGQSTTACLEEYSAPQLQALSSLIRELMTKHEAIPNDLSTIMTIEDEDTSKLNVGAAFDLMALKEVLQ